jgi:hypothetical protein
MILMPIRNKLVEAFNIDRDSFSHRLYKIASTFLLFSFAVIFFGQNTFSGAILVIKNIWQFTPWVLTDGTFYKLGLDRPNFNLMLMGLSLMVIADVLKYKGYDMPAIISRQSLWIRWCIYIGAIVLISVCGVWGHGYDATSFIYVQF